MELKDFESAAKGAESLAKTTEITTKLLETLLKRAEKWSLGPRLAAAIVLLAGGAALVLGVSRPEVIVAARVTVSGDPNVGSTVFLYTNDGVPRCSLIASEEDLTILRMSGGHTNNRLEVSVGRDGPVFYMTDQTGNPVISLTVDELGSLV